MAPLFMETFHMTPYLQKSAQRSQRRSPDKTRGKKEKDKKKKKELEQFLQFALDSVKSELIISNNFNLLAINKPPFIVLYNATISKTIIWVFPHLLT